MSNKLFVIKKPADLVAKEQKKNTLDKLWPKIVDHVSANPQLTDDDLYIMYGSSCNNGDKAKFIRRCKLAVKDMKLICVSGMSHLKILMTIEKKKMYAMYALLEQ